MNERIKEIAKQAGLIYLYDYDADGHAMVCSEKDIKKFAQLIVRECVTKMALEVMNNSWIDDAVKNTYEHFGLDQ